MNDSAPLTITGLRKTYRISRKDKIEALCGLDLTLKKGEIYGLLGPNGSGKTTVLKIILDLIRPDSGNASIFGIPHTNYLARKSVGYTPEEAGFFGFMKGKDFLKICAQLIGISKAENAREVARVISAISLETESERKIKTYSKGARQRLLIAQALLNNPGLLLLDEPTSGLDPIGINCLREILSNLKNEGVTIFLCSHLLTEVEKIADRIGILLNGMLIEEAEVSAITAHSKLEDYFMQKVGSNPE
ncbi:ABC transporter ATP-binding protein [candidate division KSB1 bacterium]|nr:ABC transporter ATP-binding protein [candidate division KSB1 bacterium]